VVLGLIGLVTSGCVAYKPQPITASAVMGDFEARRLDAPELKNFLQSRQGVKDWPPKTWDLHALTLAAFYYNPDLDVARAQWGIAQAGRITAGEILNPTLSLLMGYNGTSPVSEVTPWIPEFSLEIPIETAGKRGYRIDQARHASEAARLNILSAAWSVRSQLRQAVLELYSARETDALLARQLAIQAENVKILEAQLGVGEVSAAEVTTARLALDAGRLAAIDAANQAAAARVRLAGAIGVPSAALEEIDLAFDGLLQVRPDLPALEVRRRAMVNRADILGALAEYDAAQSALRLEIAKQYPDIALGPGFQLDQTDAKWTLGLSLVLPLLSRNKGPIAEAEARRTESAAKFLALQAGVIGDLESALTATRSAAEKLKATDDMLANFRKQEAAAQARYALGDISKLELLGLQLELSAGAMARLDALVKAQQAVGDLENAMQSPLDIKEWILETPGRTPAQAKERR
jgi:cobalt-zinc-cadmium efflux system outer membrane protein